MCRFARASCIALVQGMGRREQVVLLSSRGWAGESKLYHSRRGRERGKEKEKSFQNSSLC